MQKEKCRSSKRTCFTIEYFNPVSRDSFDSGNGRQRHGSKYRFKSELIRVDKWFSVEIHSLYRQNLKI